MKRKERGVQEWPPGSGRFRVDYYDAEGRRHREMVGSEKLAIKIYHLRKAAILEGRKLPSRKRRLTFTELSEQAMAHKKSRLAPLSYAMDAIRIKKLRELFGAAIAEDLSEGRIDKAFRELREKGLSGSTVNRYRSLLSSVYSYGERSGLVEKNPVKRVRRFRENEGRMRFLGADEELALREWIRATCAENEPLLDLALHTGMRRGEQFGLRWADVDLERAILTVRGKSGRRFVRVNSSAREALESLHKASNGSEFVCPAAKRVGQRDWTRWFEDSIAGAKIDDFTWHDLRHTFASRLVMAGVDLRSIQELLGHKSILMTMRYAHLAPDHQKANLEKLVGPKQLLRAAATAATAQTA